MFFFKIRYHCTQEGYLNPSSRILNPQKRYLNLIPPVECFTPRQLFESLQWNVNPPPQKGNWNSSSGIMNPLEVNLNPSSGIINLLGHGWISKSFCVKSKIVNSDFSNPSTENEIPLLVSSGIEFLIPTSLSPFFLCIMMKDYNYIIIIIFIKQ